MSHYTYINRAQSIIGALTNINTKVLAQTIADYEKANVELIRPLDYERQLWLAIKLSIKPHLEGTMPLLVEQTYAAEAEQQREYRKRVYRSKSKYLLLQSIQDVYKIAQSDDFIVDIPEDLDTILSRTMVGSQSLGKDIIKNIFSTIYIDRVRDPNAFIGIVPKNYLDAQMGQKKYDVCLYPSENIVLKSATCLAFVVSSNRIRVYTPNAIFEVGFNGLLAGGTMPFVHNNNDLGAYILGGAPQNIEIKSYDGATQVIEVQFSDYSYAVDELDKLENRNSQNEVVTNLHAHPRMVARDLTCTTCDGHGDIDQIGIDGLVVNRIIDEGKTDINGRDLSYAVPMRKACPSCNGKKVINIGTQDVITVPNPTAADPTDLQSSPISDLAKGIIAYIAPDITSADYLYKQLNDSLQNCKEMLRLQRFENFGESGAAKRIDQEAGQPRMRAVAEGLQTLIRSVLVGLTNFEFTVAGFSQKKKNTLSQIKVSIPSFFDMMTVAESKENYFLNLNLKRTGERYLEERNIIKKQYNSFEELAIFDIAYYYTNGASMLLAEEKNSLKAMGALTEFDVYVATFIDAIIRNIIRAAKDTLSPIDLRAITKAEFSALIDAELLPIMQKKQSEMQSQLDATNSLLSLPMDTHF